MIIYYAKHAQYHQNITPVIAVQLLRATKESRTQKYIRKFRDAEVRHNKSTKIEPINLFNASEDK